MQGAPTRVIATTALIVLVAAAISLAADGKGGKPRGQVSVATTGGNSELIERLPITRRAGAEPRVAMSLGPARLPRLRRGDRLELSAEVQVTLNCNEREPRCIGRPYRYDPRLRARLMLAGSRSARDGMLVGKPQRDVCRQRRPREHHCVITMSRANVRVGRLRSLPCPPDRCYANLVLDASNPSADSDDVLIVGGVKPNGAIPQDRGRVNSVLFRPGSARYPRPQRTRKRRRAALPLDLKRHVVYSERLRRVRAGDSIVARASVFTEERGLPYSVRTSSQLILATSPDEVRPGPLARRVGGKGELSEANGFNCTRNKSVCVTRKVGVLRARRSARQRGRFRPLYVNVVMIAGAKRVKPGARDDYPVLRRGGLSVIRYPGG